MIISNPDPDPTGQLSSDPDPDPTCQVIMDQDQDPDPNGKKFQIRADPDLQHSFHTM